MSYLAHEKTWKLTDGAGSYALLTFPIGGTAFTLQPADAAYVPTTLSEITDSYVSLYIEAKQIVATELGITAIDFAAVLDQLGWVEDASIFTVTHSGGTWDILPSGDTLDRFNVVQSRLVDYLNELTNYE